MNFDINEQLPYRIGGLLYMPAFQSNIVYKMANSVYPCLTSIAFCLEDSIQDNALVQAEEQLHQTLLEIREQIPDKGKRPLLFIRVRTPQHLSHIHHIFSDVEELLTGYILPKFDLQNANEYSNLICKINEMKNTSLYIMPILESKMIADIETRIPTLLKLKDYLDNIRPYVLNIRVGGNDFSNLYGLRRPIHQTIYNIGVIRDILVDIINVFAEDYVVSGPVWEYFGSTPAESWAIGLKAELEQDALNGFIGKTAIHPSQLPIIFESLKVTKADYTDALSILNWTSIQSGVSKSNAGNRMNEMKCHTKWAKRIYTLAQIYGIRE